jgi:methionine-rich copper-binding protein CopC
MSISGKVVGLAALMLCSWPAVAHAILVSATPAANHVVDRGKIPVKLHFNARIDAKRSRLSLVGPEGGESPLSIEESAPNTLGAIAEGLSAGLYILRWQVLATDGHITRGEVPFRVK